MIDMRGMKRVMKLAEWTKLIQHRYESGKTVTAWCEEHGIRQRQYHYWQRRVREEAVKKAAMNQDNTAIVPIGGINEEGKSITVVQEGMLEFAKVEIKRPSSMLAMSIHIGAAECAIYNGADTDVIERALFALGKIC